MGPTPSSFMYQKEIKITSQFVVIFAVLHSSTPEPVKSVDFSRMYETQVVLKNPKFSRGVPRCREGVPWCRDGVP